MKWIQHDTDANQDAKLQNVLLDYGLEGYGLYWYCIELIGGKVDKDNITFELEHDARIIARNVGSTAQKVEEMMRYFVKEGLFESTHGAITCLKIAKRLNKSMTSNSQMREIIGNFNSHDAIMTQSEKVMQDNITLENNRVEKNKQIDQSKIDRDGIVSDAFNYFWLNMFLPKKAKPVGQKAFTKAVKTFNDPMHFAKFIVGDTEARFNNQQIGFDKMHPATYLNQTRWEDEHTIDKKPEKVKSSDGGDWAKYAEETF
jgi:hypothetical protein